MVDPLADFSPRKLRFDQIPIRRDDHLFNLQPVMATLLELWRRPKRRRHKRWSGNGARQPRMIRIGTWNFSQWYDQRVARDEVTHGSD